MNVVIFTFLAIIISISTNAEVLVCDDLLADEDATLISQDVNSIPLYIPYSSLANENLTQLAIKYQELDLEYKQTQTPGLCKKEILFLIRFTRAHTNL